MIMHEIWLPDLKSHRNAGVWERTDMGSDKRLLAEILLNELRGSTPVQNKYNPRWARLSMGPREPLCLPPSLTHFKRFDFLRAAFANL